MPLECNIDAKGKAVRLGLGVALTLAAILVALVWAWPARRWGPWVAVAALLAFGAFTIFEARAGWCVMRAMGFKTRM